MNPEPTVERLLGAVAGFLKDLQPRLEGRDAFLAKVSVNALELVVRDLQLRPAMQAQALDRLRPLLGVTSEEGSRSDAPEAACEWEALTLRLTDRIRAGDFDGARSAALLLHLGRSAADQVRIDQPGYSGLRAFDAVTG